MSEIIKPAFVLFACIYAILVTAAKPTAPRRIVTLLLSPLVLAPLLAYGRELLHGASLTPWSIVMIIAAMQCVIFSAEAGWSLTRIRFWATVAAGTALAFTPLIVWYETAGLLRDYLTVFFVPILYMAVLDSSPLVTFPRLLNAAQQSMVIWLTVMLMQLVYAGPMEGIRSTQRQDWHMSDVIFINGGMPEIGAALAFYLPIALLTISLRQQKRIFVVASALVLLCPFVFYIRSAALLVIISITIILFTQSKRVAWRRRILNAFGWLVLIALSLSFSVLVMERTFTADGSIGSTTYNYLKSAAEASNLSLERLLVGRGYFCVDDICGPDSTMQNYRNVWMPMASIFPKYGLLMGILVFVVWAFSWKSVRAVRLPTHAEAEYYKWFSKLRTLMMYLPIIPIVGLGHIWAGYDVRKVHEAVSSYDPGGVSPVYSVGLLLVWVLYRKHSVERAGDPNV